MEIIIAGGGGLLIAGKVSVCIATKNNVRIQVPVIFEQHIP
jgi:hypothetical protein